MSELVILGAHEKLARVHAERDDTITRRRLADRVRRRDIPADRAAADEVRRGGIDDVAEQRSLEAQAQARQAGHAVRSKRWLLILWRHQRARAGDSEDGRRWDWLREPPAGSQAGRVLTATHWRAAPSPANPAAARRAAAANTTA